MGLSKKTAINDNDILASILRIDGTGSGIDADMVDGSHAGDLIPSIDPTTKHWIIQNTDTGILAEGVAGSNGITPHIDPTTKHWFIGTTDTGIFAEGADGINGTNGTNGTNGITPHIDPTTKHWFIGTTDTGIVAEGADGSSTDKATQAEAEAGTEDTHYMTPLKTKQAIAIFAVSAAVSANLVAANWIGTSAPYTQTITVNGMTASKNGLIGLSQSATATQREQARAAMLSITAQGTNTLTITADAIKPTGDIPVNITILV